MIRSLLILLVCTATTHAQVTDVARLFPPGTLAYAELHDPAKLGPELAAIVKGSAIEDSLKFVHERRDKTKNVRDLMVSDEFAILGLLTSPELVGEFRKIRGAAIAVTGFNERQAPDVAAAVLLGDSQAIGLAIRAYLTVQPQIRKIGVASGVPIFQYRMASMQYNNNGQPLPANEKPVEEGFDQATFAYTPGLLVVGNSKAAVADVLARHLDSAKKTLADDAVFQAAAAKNRTTGVFAFARPGDLAVKLDAIHKQTGEHVDTDVYAMLKMIANVKSMRSISASLRFRDNGMSLAADIALEPGSTSPLLAMLEGQHRDASPLRHLPGETAFAMSFALPAEKRAAAVLSVLDADAKANGALGRLPSQTVAEIAAKFKVRIAEDLLAKTDSVTVVLPSRQELPKGVPPLPTFVLHGEASANWPNALRALAAESMGSSELAAPSSEVVEGVKVFSLSQGKLPIHYASAGTAFAFGPDRKIVAECVKGGEPAQSLPGGLNSQAAAIGVFAPARFAAYLKSAAKSQDHTEGPRVVTEELPIGLPRQRFRSSDGQPVDPEVIKQEAAAYEEMMAALHRMPSIMGTVRRNGDAVHLDWFAPEIQGAAMKLALDRAVTWFDRLTAASGKAPHDTQGILKW